MRLIKQTYDVVTPESAEQGDFAETGWNDEIGTEITPDVYDIDEYETESAAVVALAVKHITQHGGVEPSDYPRCHVGHTWYTTADSERDYTDGSETRYSFHLEGFYAEEETAIYAALTGRIVRN